MNAIAKQTGTIHEWDTVDWDYPSCGGTIGSVNSNGVATVTYLSNLQGQSSGSVSVWKLNQDAIDVINNDELDYFYNDYNTWRQMVECHIEYIATLLPGGKKGRIVR